MYNDPKVVFHGQRIDVLSVADGTKRREVVAHPGAVIILPFLDQERIIMIKNERIAVMETLWELPAGTLEKKEDRLLCAHRELEEETGYRASQMSPLLEFFSSPGFSNEILHAYVAKDLTYVGQSLDDTEKIEVEIMKFTEALSMIKTGLIRDAKTICTLLFYATHHHQASALLRPGL